MNERECVTHHHACDCREARFHKQAQALHVVKGIVDAALDNDSEIKASDPTPGHELEDAIKYVQNLHAHAIRKRLDCSENDHEYWKGAESHLYKVVQFFGEG